MMTTATYERGTPAVARKAARHEIPLRLPSREQAAEFGAWARRRREELGLTQQQIAERYFKIVEETGSDQPRDRDQYWFSRLENARVQIQSGEELEILARVYMVTPVELIEAMGYDVGITRQKRDPDITDLYTLTEDMDAWARQTILKLYQQHMEQVERQQE